MPELPLQAVAIEFRVRGALNGTSRPGRFEVPPARVGVGNPSQAQVIEIPGDLGLIDLTAFARGGALADRIITTLLIIGPAVPTGVNNVQIARGGAPIKNVLTIPAAANGIYSRNCILVPQGRELRLSGMSAIPGNVILVQLGFQLADTLPALAEMKLACCCLNNTLNQFGEPAYVHALYTEAACTRTIDSVVPSPVSRAVGTQSFTIGGSGFTTGDVAAFINHDTQQVLPILNVNVAAPNTMQVLVDVGVASTGSYDVFVAPPLSGGICGAVLENAITITP